MITLLLAMILLMMMILLLTMKILIAKLMLADCDDANDDGTAADDDNVDDDYIAADYDKLDEDYDYQSLEREERRFMVEPRRNPIILVRPGPTIALQGPHPAAVCIPTVRPPTWPFLIRKAAWLLLASL
jgi:hypothetical protein